MTGNRQRQLVFGNALAVIAYTQQSNPGILNIHINARCTRIETVFDQLFQHTGRAFNHLASGDLVDKLRGKKLNNGHAFARKT